MRLCVSEAMKILPQGKRLDVVVLTGVLGLGWLYAHLTRGSYIGKPLFVFLFHTSAIVPYLSIRRGKNWRKIALATLLLGVIFAFFLDFVCEFTRSWTTVALVFQNKILGIVPIDNLLAYVMMTLWTVVFYEHFVDDSQSRKVSPNFLYGALLGLLAIAATLTIYTIKPSLILQHHYPYLCMGLAAIALPVFFAVKRTILIKKMVITASYFFLLYFMLEMYAVSFDWWIYTGNNYIGWVTILGRTFPFEEFFFWIMFYAASLVSYYEIFIDDLK